MTQPAKYDVVRSVEAEVLALLRRARRRTGERARMIDPALGPLGYQVLAHVRDQDGCSQAHVADALGMDKGSVSRQVQQLAELGLVVRAEDPTDRRICVVRLSDEGERRMRELGQERRSAYAARFDDWTVDELTVLAEQLAKYNRTLEK
jgi:DNA-binding MarR family transcriptional regulator